MNLRRLAAVTTAATLAIVSAAAAAQTQGSLELARSKNCVACHSVDKKLIGPAFKDIAAKYAGDKTAADRLAKKVRSGGVGVWGQIPMPANPQVNDQEALALVNWILSIK